MARQRYTKVLSTLLPLGALGMSFALASAIGDAQAASRQNVADPLAAHAVAVEGQLQAIRDAVSAAAAADTQAGSDPNVWQAGWRNWWRNWPNWNNWRNGWGNWPNWHNWHNVWRNY